MKRLVLAAGSLLCVIHVMSQAPAGYYTNTSGKSCDQLKTSLKGIVTTGHTPRSYNDLWAQFQSSDVKPREVGSGSAMVIWDIYSDRPGPANDPYNFTPGTGTGGQQDQGSGGGAEGQYYNREHSVPLSWFDGSTGTPGPSTDYHHIFPTDKYVNGIRGSLPYGKVGTANLSTQNGSRRGTSAVAGINGDVFEPIDSFKGDVARAFLYFVTRYEDQMASYAGNTENADAFQPNTYPSVDIPFLRLMLQWHELDPVSTKEVNRNNAAYTFQGNRNPYIDSPQYVNRVWNSTCTGLSALPVDMIVFGGKLSGNTVTLEWQVSNEMNLHSYEIEKSVNGISYRKVGEVKATGSRRYDFADNIESNRSQRVYYRLRKLGTDGSYQYSEVFSIHVPSNNRFSVYPNPASDYLVLQLREQMNGNVLVRITDASGRMARQENIKANGVIRLETSDLKNGTYLVIVYYNGEQFYQKVVINR